MGAEAITLSIAAISAASATAGAVSANSGIRRAERAAVQANQIERNQLKAQRDLEREKRALELDRVRSRQRVLAANAGQSIDGSFGLLMDQAVLDYGINQRIADANYAARGARSQSELAAQFANLERGRQSPLFAGIQGGIQGYLAGNAISGLVSGGGAAAAGGVDSSLNTMSTQTWGNGYTSPLTIGDIRTLATS